jgi:hypothetical protein
MISNYLPIVFSLRNALNGKLGRYRIDVAVETNAGNFTACRQREKQSEENKCKTPVFYHVGIRLFIYHSTVGSGQWIVGSESSASKTQWAKLHLFSKQPAMRLWRIHWGALFSEGAMSLVLANAFYT